MIKPGEIQKIAAAQGLRDTQIEKDYVIGWVLNGLARQKELKRTLIFKGGTSLRKIYFPNYRLSEDLDFTFVGNKLNEEKIIKSFELLSEWVFEESRIEIRIEDITEHTTGNINFYLTYTGALGGKGAHKKIKIDISSDEIICCPPEERNVLNEYSDLESYLLLVYSLKEIIAEKMRSVMQRTEPRDIYDLWYLFEYEGAKIEEHVYAFRRKAENKGLDSNKFVETVKRKEQIFKRQWENRLVNQVRELPNFDDIWRELGKHLRRFEKFK